MTLVPFFKAVFVGVLATTLACTLPNDSANPTPTEPPQTTQPQPSAAPDEPPFFDPALNSTDPDALTYSRLSMQSDMHYGLFLHQFDLQPAEVTRHEIDGPTAWDLLVQHRLSTFFDDAYNDYLRRLLERPDARAIYFETAPGEDRPTGGIFIPSPDPQSFEVAPSAASQNGAFLMLGIGLSDTATSSTDSQPASPPPEGAPQHDYPSLTQGDWDELKDTDGTHLVLAHGKSCRASAGLLSELDALLNAHQRTSALRIDHGAAITGPTLDDLVARRMFPTLLVLHDGRVVDVHVGVGSHLRARLAHLLVRNDLVDADAFGDAADPTAPINDGQAEALEPEVWRRRISVLRHWSAHDFRNANLAGIRLSHAALTGSSFVGADLRDADLRNAVLSHADFKDANLEGADVEGALWYRTICPNGSMSEDYGGMCEGTW
ncbi:pentapeptide repeat-containing protein [Lujinxingia sediminis]|uniref:Pentapeptide repeat-containing protein n=1 Tax=Lujinxingia sediminis TaxID=2480984 RepID=A0ABY0CMR6_9DELT|nr:pentapeptide repeat-containing protein [Lujinxingia sediminis]RVU40715.1 pentapeptide repeat-containing protein [Lujinxingia sediminis]